MSPLDTLTHKVGRFAVGDVVRVRPIPGTRLQRALKGDWKILALHAADGMKSYADLGQVDVPNGPTRSIVLDRLVKRRKWVGR